MHIQFKRKSHLRHKFNECSPPRYSYIMHTKFKIRFIVPTIFSRTIIQLMCSTFLPNCMKFHILSEKGTSFVFKVLQQNTSFLDPMLFHRKINKLRLQKDFVSTIDLTFIFNRATATVSVNKLAQTLHQTSGFRILVTSVFKHVQVFVSSACS